MCLTRLEKVEHKGYGWKIFTKYKGKDNLFKYLQGSLEEYPINKWIDESSYKLTYKVTDYTEEGGRYRLGFHIFRFRKDVRRYKKLSFYKNIVIRKVMFDEVVATGVQRFTNLECKVIVAKKMYIEKGD
jgi:hypothetical protein